MLYIIDNMDRTYKSFVGISFDKEADDKIYASHTSKQYEIDEFKP